MEKIGIVIQARSGSTRLPGKMLKPFFQGKNILEILIERLKSNSFGIPVTVATSELPGDDQIASVAESSGAKVFRGSESDVMSRFVQVANGQGLETVVRVCADNPFLDLALFERLVSDFKESPSDYRSYRVGEKPAILTHYGFFCEIVSAGALEKASKLTEEKLYREHVTNFIYGNPGIFHCEWTPAPERIVKSENVRLTIDTAGDFATAQMVFGELAKRNLDCSYENVLDILEEFPELEKGMKREIDKNSK
ncbi:cytidylyltransferase domain-containing protein [Fulvitalea axinellae]